MKFKRLLAFALAATLSFSALTGCGTTNPDSTSAADYKNRLFKNQYYLRLSANHTCTGCV